MADAKPVAPVVELAPGAAQREVRGGTPANWFSVDRESQLALAETCAEGDGRYGVDNWRKGIPVSNLINHAMDHLSRTIGDGDNSEPHIQHAMWNLGKVLWMAKHRPDMVDVPMVRKALGLAPIATTATTTPTAEPKLAPADPNPHRNTNCWFCGKPLEAGQPKVITPRNQYRQAHTGCYNQTSAYLRDEFNELPGGPDAKLSHRPA